MTMFWKCWNLTFWPHPRVKGMGKLWWVSSSKDCYHVDAFVIPLNLICNMTMFRRNLNFDLLNPTPGCCICDSLKFDMQHDHALKELNYDLLIPPHMVGAGSGVGVICVLNFYYHVSALGIPLNLICSITIFWKKMNFDLLTPPQGRRDGVCRQNMFYYVAAFVIPLLLPCCCICDVL